MSKPSRPVFPGRSTLKFGCPVQWARGIVPTSPHDRTYSHFTFGAVLVVCHPSQGDDDRLINQVCSQIVSPFTCYGADIYRSQPATRLALATC